MSESTLNLTTALQAHREQNADACLQEVNPILQNAPHHPVALHLKAWAVSKKGEKDRALKILSEVIENNPKLVPARAEYGAILMDNRRHSEALKPLREAYELQPERDEVAIKYCSCLIKNGQFFEAESKLRQILDNSPHHFEARYLLATALLQQGKWEEGFDHYQIRFWLDCMNRDEVVPTNLIEWKGEDLTDKSILIQCEQSYADQVMFIRYANWLKEAFNPEVIVVHAAPEMRELLESVEAVDEVITNIRDAQVDRYVPLLNLPHYHKTTPGTIPFSSEAYLSVSEQKTQRWNERLTDEQPKIGICWKNNLIGDENAGSMEREVKSLDRKYAEHVCKQIRSMFQDAEIISLQPANNKKEKSMLRRNGVIDIGKQPINDFSDLAAVVDRMDLVVTIDTTVAHIAGALEKPVWNLLPFYPDWRYSQDEEYSNWYPNMRLFRQQNEGDWMSLDSPELLAELVASGE